ncbi:MAG: putative Se/S carrier-like protein [Thermoleophilia bacterium]
MVLLFLTTQSALQAEEILLEKGLTVDVVPRPEGAPGGLCGLALDVLTEELAEADYLLSHADVEFRLFEGGSPAEPGRCGEPRSEQS